ncbi:MAG: ABC transporter ATP-binding protein [Candidatus Limnocylindria bacterium]
MAMMGAAISVRGVTKRYGAVEALRNLDLDVERGEFVVLLGPSGCGKTTLLRSLAGLETPDDGQIQIGGSLVFSEARGVHVRPGRRGVGMVFQSYALWPHMSVEDNVGFGLQLQKLSTEERRRRVERVLTDLGLAGLGGRFPFQLSGGQQQRVALARLLVSGPSVFLMDEPLSNLDARLRLDMRAEIKRLHHERGATTIYVTHDQTEALTMASRVVVMDRGTIQQIGTPREIYARPANLFVAEFVGMPSINLLPARAVTGDGRSALSSPLGELTIGWIPPSDEMVIAVRPEDVRVMADASPDSTSATVHAVQPAGPEQFVHLRCGEEIVVARTPPDQAFEMDQPVWLSVERGALGFYDRSTGLLFTPPN